MRYLWHDSLTRSDSFALPFRIMSAVGPIRTGLCQPCSRMLMKKRTSSRQAAEAPRDADSPAEPAESGKAPARAPSRPRGAAKSVGPRTPLEETVLHASPGTRTASTKPQERDIEVDPLVGQRVGQYHIESIVGRGSMARVYKARHLGLGAPLRSQGDGPRA